jgi:hypothetical protein
VAASREVSSAFRSLLPLKNDKLFSNACPLSGFGRCKILIIKIMESNSIIKNIPELNGIFLAISNPSSFYLLFSELIQFIT